MKLAKTIYRVVGAYGLLVITPLFFLERTISERNPPALSHPEYYYGFAVAVFAWQFAFFVIASDPARYRALMPVTWVEKAYGLFALWLYGLERASAQVRALGVVDLALGVLFVIAYLKTRDATAPLGTNLGRSGPFNAGRA